MHAKTDNDTIHHAGNSIHLLHKFFRDNSVQRFIRDKTTVDRETKYLIVKIVGRHIILIYNFCFRKWYPDQKMLVTITRNARNNILGYVMIIYIFVDRSKISLKHDLISCFDYKKKGGERKIDSQWMHIDNLYLCQSTMNKVVCSLKSENRQC